MTRRHARGPVLTGEQEAAALADLAEVADGRIDLLAQQAGLAIGLHEHDRDAAVYLQIAQLCIRAGADIAAWSLRCRAISGSAAAGSPSSSLRSVAPGA
jgi:hypothetical protein